MHPITAALEQSMSPERIDPTKYKSTHVVKPQGFYQENAILVGNVWYSARTGRKINRPVKIILYLRKEVYNKFHPHPDGEETPI